MGNRRRHKRVSLLKEVDVACLNDKAAAKGLIVNISRSGMIIYTTRPLGTGNEIVIKLPFVDEYKVDRIETLVGDIRWTKPLEDFYAIGIQFKSINEHDHFMLLAYLNYAEGFEKPCINE
ncbi:MAG: PilZ domain-containing protein [Nitrospira sp.]|nr:PilZ domain-containing protein [Nitrospira sp.]